jgi:hypothetical protein
MEKKKTIVCFLGLFTMLSVLSNNLLAAEEQTPEKQNQKIETQPRFCPSSPAILPPKKTPTSPAILLPKKISTRPQIPFPKNTGFENATNVDNTTSLEDLDLSLIKGETYNIQPDIVTPVRFSSLHINRIYCPGEVQDVVYSEEKGLTVKVVGSDVFVKFKLVKNPVKGEIIETANEPAELYVVCNNRVYSLILIPRKIPSTIIYLEKDKKTAINENLSLSKSIPFEKRLVEVISSLMKGKVPEEANVVKVGKPIEFFKALNVVEEEDYRFEGEGFVVKVFSVRLSPNVKNEYIDLFEKDFLKKEISKAPVAIALSKLRLYKNDKVLLFVIERIISEEFDLNSTM